METLDKPIALKSLHNGIQIYFVPLVEYTSISDSFERDEVDEIIKGLESCNLVWFCAKVYAEFKGFEIAADYLGGCLYESFEEFHTGRDYIIDMVNAVEFEGINYLKELKNELNSISI